MDEFYKILSVSFEVIVALIVLGTAIYSFLHAKKGEDIAAVPFGVAHLVLFIAQMVTIFVLMSDSVGFSDSFLIYVKWHLGFSYIVYALGVFFSIFLNGRLYSILSIPAMTLSTIVLGLGFVPSFFPLFPSFDRWGWFIWIATAGILFAASLMYFLFYIRQKERFRLIMCIAFLALVTSNLLLLLGDTGIATFISSILRFLGFGMIFYEVQANYI
jgi:uncharacterized membrane protein YedE/YeeE